jgi:PQ loop repeat
LRPQFYEIYKYRAVFGISLTFMAIDCLGGIFSVLSLVFKHRFDAIAAVTYSLVVVRCPGHFFASVP